MRYAVVEDIAEDRAVIHLVDAPSKEDAIDIVAAGLGVSRTNLRTADEQVWSADDLLTTDRTDNDR